MAGRRTMAVFNPHAESVATAREVRSRVLTNQPTNQPTNLFSCPRDTNGLPGKGPIRKPDASLSDDLSPAVEGGRGQQGLRPDRTGRRYWFKQLFHLILVVFCIGLAHGVRAATLDYIHDEVGRLVGVVDTGGTGESAVYNYDASGNLLGVQRHAAGQPVIIEFPNQAVPGSTILIRGSGFDSAPNGNAVSFNGVPSTSVTVVDATTLSVQVPDTATSGPITLTTPSGSYTSATGITFGAAPTAPTITSFTPTIGTDGIEEGTPPTPITLTGGQFAANLTENKLFLNGSPMPLISGAATTLVAELLSGATSGHFNLTTPDGTATSTEDFYVEPKGFAAADVVIRQRLTPNGASYTGNFTAPNQVSVLLFEGEAGKDYGVGLTGGLFSTTASLYSSVYVLAPGGQTALATTTLTSTPSGYSETIGLLKESGTYSVVLANGTRVGDVTVTVSEGLQAGALILDGGSKTVSITRSGQNAKLTFAGTANQRLYLRAPSETFSNSVAITIYLPATDGSASVTSGNLYSRLVWNSGSWTGALTLPTSGEYTVFVDPNGGETGNISFELVSVPADVTGVITIDGPTVQLTTTVSGQNGMLTFMGNANQHVYLKDVTDNFTNSVYITIYKPATDGSASITNGAIFDTAGWTTGDWTDAIILPATGTYTVKVDPYDWGTGHITLELDSVPADVTGTIAIGGPQVTVTTTVAGQNASLTFTGNANQVVNLHEVSESYSASYGIKIYLPAPDGSASTANGTIYSDGDTFIWSDALTLPVTGTYTIFIDPTWTPGSTTLELLSVPGDATGTITIDGSSKKLTTTVPGQNGKLTFTGAAGQRVALQETASTHSYNVGVAIYKPAADGTASTQNGSIYYYSSGNNGWFAGDWTDVLTLPATGTYTIYADPKYDSTGSITFKLTSVAVDKTGTLTINGAAVKITLSSAGQNARYTFISNTAGAQITVKVTNNLIGSLNVYLRDLQTGAVLASASNSAKAFNLPAATVGVGTYEVEVNPSGTNTGSLSLAVTSP
jgi:YD repeat-containing protein